jgi:hypothetical protein
LRMAPTDHGLPTREAYKAGRDKKLTPGEKAAIEKVKQAAIKGVCARYGSISPDAVYRPRACSTINLQLAIVGL